MFQCLPQIKLVPSSLVRGLLLAVALSSQACDPGFSYRLDGWAAQGKSYEWTKSFDDGVKLTTWGIGGLVGSESIISEFEIENKGSATVVLESAGLLVGGHISPARLPGQGEVRWRTVSPGAVKRISLQWSFNESASKAVGSKPKLILTLDQDGEPLTIKIVYMKGG